MIEPPSRAKTSVVANKPSYSLIVPTKDRTYHLARRLPTWTRQGFDEVTIVDGSRDADTRTMNAELCQQFGAKYLSDPGNRSRARNLGARSATSSWVLFSDDDLWGYATFDRPAMDRLVVGHDWLIAPDSQVIGVFRREFFLSLGGYKENLVLGEDDDLTDRTRALGKGGLLVGVFASVGFTPDERERALDFKRRLSNYIEYSFTMWNYLHEVKQPGRVAFSWGLSLLRLSRELLRRDLRVIPYLLGASGGLVFGLLVFLFRRSPRRPTQLAVEGENA